MCIVLTLWFFCQPLFLVLLGYCFFLGLDQALKTYIQSEIIKSFCEFRDSAIKVKLDHESTGHRLLKPTSLTHAPIRD